MHAGGAWGPPARGREVPFLRRSSGGWALRSARVPFTAERSRRRGAGGQPCVQGGRAHSWPRGGLREPSLLQAGVLQAAPRTRAGTDTDTLSGTCGPSSSRAAHAGSGLKVRCCSRQGRDSAEHLPAQQDCVPSPALREQTPGSCAEGGAEHAAQVSLAGWRPRRRPAGAGAAGVFPGLLPLTCAQTSCPLYLSGGTSLSFHSSQPASAS